MAELGVKQVSMLKNCEKPFDLNNNYRKAYRFADDKLKSELEGYIKFINDRNENARLEYIYSKAERAMKSATDKDSFVKAAEIFESIEEFKDSKELAKQCREKGGEAYRKAQYDKAVSLFENPNNEADCEAAKCIFEELGDYKDSKSYLDKYDEKVEEVRKDAIYYNAMETKNERAVFNKDREIADLDRAAQLFESILKWKDAEKQAELCRKEIEEIKAKQKALEQEEAKRKKIKKILSISIPSTIAVVVAFVIILNEVIIPNNKYNQFLEYINNEDYINANLILRDLGDYKDTEQLIKEHKIDFQNYVSAGDYHTVSLKSDGTVEATGDNDYGQCDVSDWSNIVAVSVGDYHTVGLKSDGTVVATGKNDDGQCDVSGWRDIVAVSAGGYHTVGLKSDGTVVATGDNDYGQCDVSDWWRDIVAVSAGGYHTVGLKSDGIVVATGDNGYGQCDVSDWSDIVAISAGGYHTVGLKSDGTVVAKGVNHDAQCDVSGWSDIIAVSPGIYHTIGLKSDGTVVATGDNEYGRCDVSDWYDIVVVSAGNSHTVGLKSDGTVVATGKNNYGQCYVSDWKLW